MSQWDTFKEAQALASELAEDELQANMAEMFIEHSREKAKAVRALVEANKDTLATPTAQEYRSIHRSVYGAIYSLLEGYKGYKLVKL